MKRSAPMRRTGFKRKEPKPFALPDRQQFERNQESRKRTQRKKVTVAEGSKYLAACRGEPCYLRIVGVCCGNSETVVPAHSNESAHGKGMGIKADHVYTVPACFTCHAWLDQGPAWRNEKVMAWRTAYARWEPVRARKMGITRPEMEMA